MVVSLSYIRLDFKVYRVVTWISLTQCFGSHEVDRVHLDPFSSERASECFLPIPLPVFVIILPQVIRT